MDMKWKLKDILMVAIVGVLFSFLFLGADYVGAALTAALTPMGLGALGYQFIYGIWFMAATFATYVIQKRGVGIIAEMLAAVIEVMMGGMFGPMTLVTGFCQGLGCEIGFAIFRYKKFGWSSMILSSIICAVFTFIVPEYFAYGYSAYALPILIAALAIRVVSSILFTGVVSKLIGDGLAKAGVLRGYALGMKQNLPEEME